MITRTVTITDRDIEFVRLALAHYRVLAQEMEKLGSDREHQRSAGVMRAQEFHAERFLIRLTATEES